ncbi:MAG: DUF3267 domain-containing protein [Clostridia bacterium]|nr:DUF3267 domain-containing protein [Clostridia bacterium]
MGNIESTLPEGYRQVLKIDAADKKTGMLLTVACLAVTALLVTLSLIPLGFSLSFDVTAMAVFVIGMLAYIVLHELTHGAAYKLLTKRRLTFGFKWSCAFCGVPDVFVYRRASIIALVGPLVLFTVLLAPLALALFFVSEALYFATALLFAYHLGGCVGDGYMLILLLFKYKNKDILIKDTGPVQYIYERISANEKEKR